MNAMASMVGMKISAAISMLPTKPIQCLTPKATAAPSARTARICSAAVMPSRLIAPNL